MPGYGRSAKSVDHTDPFGYLANMIRGLLDQLGIDSAHLVGNSYGGSCALRLALDTPHRVGKLVLMGPGGIGTTRGIPSAGLKSLLTYYTGEDLPATSWRPSSATIWSTTAPRSPMS